MTLTDSGMTLAHRIENDGLILRGHASTYYAKQMAQHVAVQVSGLPVVANEIEVN